MSTTHFSGPVNSTAGFQNGSSAVEDITAVKTLTASDNGKYFQLNAAAGVAVTLPAVALSAGYRVRFTTKAAFATTPWVITSAEGDNLEGSVIVAGAVVDVDAADVINFVESAENIGDYVELWSDGTQWYAFGNALTVGALTATG